MATKTARKRKSSVVDTEIKESLQVNWSLSSFKIKKPFHFNEKHKSFYDCIKRDETNMVLVDGPAGSAKAQPLDAKILTPTGYTRMGDIKVGDLVFTQSGNTTPVIGVFPQGEKQIYRVSFSDGSSTECCEDHLWFTQSYNDRAYKKKVNGIRVKEPRVGSVKSLKQIMLSLYVGNSININHSIPICEPVKFKKREHIIHPYILGVLLGDGCILQSISFCTTDQEILDAVENFLPANHTISADSSCSIGYRIVGVNRINLVLEELRRLKLYGCNSLQKFIPDDYLYDSTENRLWLLRGLMDTDGWADKQGCVGFNTVSPALCEGVKFLVESLGGTYSSTRTHMPWYTHAGIKRVGKMCYSVVINSQFDIFNLARKLIRVRKRKKYFPIRYITSIEPVGIKEAQCIMVEHPSHLYLTDNCIVTHNTYIGILSALELLQERKIKNIIYIRSVVESASKSIGALPGEVDDKFMPYAMPLIEKVQEITDATTSTYLHTLGVLKAIPVNFVRGLTFNDSIVIVDEIQNLTIGEITTILTRFGKNTKYVLCGDSFQADIGKMTCINRIINAFDTQQSRDMYIDCFRFGESEIVRSKILKYIVKVLEKVNPH